MGRVIRWFKNILGLKKKDKGERTNSSFGKPKEQSKHAAANAAVTATEAAVSVVRLTSHGRKTMLGGGRETWGALKIQSSFRGHLARKALRALKGLVKFQALVRGYLVRKQATATLHSLQTLIRAQQTVRVQKANGPVVPAKRPNYMSTTQSFRAKMRPQQGRKKSLSEVSMQWSSCSQVQQVIFKNAVMRGLDR
ncbi:hypothetical protein Sjap_021130 [Stephania japonica]|uniref:DUF4005 domain-containing protein n=1 Tax=Stephania japonica TaxID=461633 RepID=A0AAP0I0U7_9MAGN